MRRCGARAGELPADRTAAGDRRRRRAHRRSCGRCGSTSTSARGRKNLQLMVTAARGRGDALDHLLFHGPPGLGKTSLAYLSLVRGVNIRTTSAR